MKGSSNQDPRARELLIERAQRPLDDRESWELQQLGAEDDDTFDFAAASVAVAMTPYEQMPDHLAAKIFAQSPAAAASSSLLPGQMRTLAGVAPPRPVIKHEPQPVADIAQAREKKRSRAAVIAPWLAAAACLLLAVGTWWWTRTQTPTQVAEPKQLSPSEQRAKLIAEAADVTTIKWTATPDPNAKGASGDVVWSAREQKGYMRFVGLTPNDRATFQYQLWIFDKNRDDKFPVDGGVFDVSSTGEVIVPITAKLKVDDVALFAVTIERPGGVVVSKRERIVVTAAGKS